ncbi:MAG: deoxycytidylate deaminase, partial [Treponema sp.]
MTGKIQKRVDYISWDEYFMGVAYLASFRSKDPNSQVGACIVGKNNKILSMGYNGFPRGCSDDEFPWAREGDTLETKYAYVTHSELNAILNYHGTSLEGSKIYVTLFPCNECAKA